MLFVRLKQIFCAAVLCTAVSAAFAASQAFIVKAYVSGEIVIRLAADFPVDDLNLGTITDSNYGTAKTTPITGIDIYDTEPSAPQIFITATTDNYDSGVGPYVKLAGATTPTRNQKIYYELAYVPCDKYPFFSNQIPLLSPSVSSGQKIEVTAAQGGITQEACVENSDDTPGSLVLYRPVIAETDLPDPGVYTATVTLTASAT